jgi:DNA replication protein DnaC
MLQQPMMEKLQALKLQGMLEGLKQQEQDEATLDLSFLDRLALLIDRQWTWRQNQVLARRLQISRLKGSACVENIDYRAERGLNRSVIRALAQDSAWVKNHEHIFVLGPTGVERVTSLRPWRRKPAGTATRSTTPGRRRCSGI